MDDPSPIGLTRRRRAALAILWVEALMVAFWPAASGLAVAMAVAFTGVPAALPGLPHLVLLLGLVAGVGVLARRGWRSLVRPTASQADRRLEADSGLRHRPLDVLVDRPASAGDVMLWRAHQDRALAALHRLTLRGPRPGLARRDPYALRVAALLLLVAGLTIAGPSATRLLGQSVFGFTWGPPGAAPVLQAWIEPPAYTGMAPIFLSAGQGGVDVPDGSRLTVSLTGGRFQPYLSVAGHSEKFHRLGSASWQAVAMLHNSGKLRISRFFRTVAHWDLKILSNAPPVIAWAALPGQAEKSLDTSLPWKVAQRWGVASLRAELRPAHHPDLPALSIPVPLPGTPREAAGVAKADLAANPYAGVDITARLAGRDVSGQFGQSDEVTFTLPARLFHDTLARALIDLRRRLALNPAGRAESADDLDALAAVPGGHGPHAGIVLNLGAAAAMLRDQHSEASLAEAQGRLWTIALALDGALPDASEQALTQARENLRRSLDDRQHGKPNDKDIARKIEALKQALNQRLQDIARRALEKGKLKPPDGQAQKFTSPTLDRMMKQIEQAVREGRTEDAKQRLAELEKLLDKLKTARVLSPEEARQAAQAQHKGKQMMGAAQDMVRREGALMDHGQARAPAAPPLPQFRMWGQDAPPPQDQAQQGSAQKGRAEDVRTQGALNRALDALKQGFAQSGGKVPKNLDDAGRDMQQAQQALQAGNDAHARDAEGRAVADLQKGGQDMAKQMSKNTELAIAPGGQEQKGEDEEDGTGDEPGASQSADGKRDPLGRQVEGTGGRAADDGSVHVPTEIEQGRSREIQQELRRRGADRERPQHELDYIDRLLKPFAE